MIQKKITVSNLLLLTFFSLLLISCGVKNQKTVVNNDPWKTMQLVINSVKSPTFRNKTYLIYMIMVLKQMEFLTTPRHLKKQFKLVLKMEEEKYCSKRKILSQVLFI